MRLLLAMWNVDGNIVKEREGRNEKPTIGACSMICMIRSIQSTTTKRQTDNPLGCTEYRNYITSGSLFLLFTTGR